MADIPTGSAPATPASSAPPASAIVTPEASGAPVESSASSVSSGEPPRERWPDILENTRKKTRAEVEQEYKSRYGHYDEFERDPFSAVTGWLEQASEHSLLGPMVQHYITERAKHYAPPEAAQAVGEEPKPDTPIVDDQGRVTGYTYSDKALRSWQNWNEQQLLAKLEKRFGSLEQTNQRFAQQEQFREQQRAAVQYADVTLTSLRQQPYFKEHEGAVKQALMDHPEWGDNVHAAYAHVMATQILPSLGSAERREAVTALTGKGAGSTVSPGGTAPGAPKFKSFKDAARYYAEHPDEAAAMAKR